MKLVPKHFLLLGIVWSVKDADLYELGRCDRDTATIYLRKGLPDQVRESTFCHELMHAITYSMGVQDHDERVIDLMGSLLHQFLRTRS